MRHIAVIGAGITGTTTAYALSQRGFKVSLFDRHRYAAMETSYANGGQLSASNAEVWNQWSTILKGIRWLFERDAPLSFNPLPSWHKYSWMAEFIANVRHYRRHTVETARLAIAAREHLLRYAAAEGFSFDCETRGIMHLYWDKQGFDHAARVNQLLAQGGLTRRAVTPAEMRSLEPALTGDFYGGYFTESDFTGDVHRYTRGLADACRRHGVALYYDTTVDDLRHLGQGVELNWRSRHGDAIQAPFDGVVICAGVGSRRLAAQLGDRVNIYPVKGYSITVKLGTHEAQAAAPWVSLLDDRAKVVTSRLGAERLRIAGTAEFNGYNRDIRADRVRPLVHWCERLFPAVSTEYVEPWAGLRPMLPTMMPRVGSGRQPGVFYNTGHGHLGWTLAAATAELVADAVLATAEGANLAVAASSNSSSAQPAATHAIATGSPPADDQAAA